VGQPERRTLRRVADQRWPADGAWKWRVPVIVRNFSDRPLSGAVAVDWHRPEVIAARYARYKYDLPLRLEMPGAAQPLPCALSDRRLMTVITVPPMTELVLSAYLTDLERAPGASQKSALAELAVANENLVQNGDFEIAGEGGLAAAAWPTGEEGRPANQRRFTVRRVPGGVHGQWCLELDVPKTVTDIGWVGSRQKVPVKPNTTYILCGFIKCKNLEPDARIHGHFLREDGSLCQPAPFFATSPAVQGDADWTFTSATVTTPPDCRFIDVHLTMHATGTLWHDAVCLVPALQGFAGDVEPRTDVGALAAWVVNPQVKVFPDDVFPASPTEARLYACRNEYEPLQIAVRSATGGTLRVQAGALRGPGGATIAAPAVYENRYVPVDFPVGYDGSAEPAWIRHKPRYRGNDGWTGWWPDPLAPLTSNTVQLKPRHTVPLWLDYYIPAGARPGDYAGTVELRLGSTAVRVPVRLRVWPYTIPGRKHTFAIYDLRLSDQSLENVRKWYTMLARYNVSPGYVMPSPDISYENGQVKIDFAAFDRAASLLFEELNCQVSYTPWFFYAFGWGYPPKKFFGKDPFTPEWTNIFRSALRQFFDHLKQKGWDKYFVYYVSDEPDQRSEEIQGNLARICDLAREAVPGLWVYSSTWVHLPRLDGHLNVWGIGPHGSWKQEDIDARRKAGDRFWFTTDGHMCTDTPYLAIERLLPWLCFKYDVEGYEFWGVNWWTYNPWEYGWHSYHLQSHSGEVFNWTRYPNGDGFIAYPGDYVGVDGPLPSIRMIAAREGVEDYELFYALREAASRAPNTPAAEAARKALARINELVQMPNRGGRYSTYIMPDPDAALAARIAAGEALAILAEKH
ncbi:MAG: DUF4091 domain-containing protein, partial [Armatimonadetes bacterium]|nr:DUF4091 domain-containing protein [Armatimonadota bacterium]